MGYGGSIELRRKKSKAAMRKWRKIASNKERERLRGNRRTKDGYYRIKRGKLQAIIDELKAEPCTDCGKRYHPCKMQFDHVYGKKSEGICRMISLCRSPERLAKELDKCELVCANCHCERTWTRRQAKK
jgi:hypothetical protein